MDKKQLASQLLKIAKELDASNSKNISKKMLSILTSFHSYLMPLLEEMSKDDQEKAVDTFDNINGLVKDIRKELAKI